jgi:3alpha(or 20beta)-hydroxysteroid dehydrogenase
MGCKGPDKTAALNLSKYNIRVNSVHSGLILTPMTAGVEIETDQVAMNKVAMNRAGLPEEIANVVLFFAIDESSYMTGTELVADGGASARVRPIYFFAKNPSLIHLLQTLHYPSESVIFF